MADREKVVKGLECCLTLDSPCGDCPYYSYEEIQELECERNLRHDVLELLEEQQNLLDEYEKLSQVCFKIEKYLRIADLSILIDRIEEGKVEVLQDDGRPDLMETTIKIRRL